MKKSLFLPLLVWQHKAVAEAGAGAEIMDKGGARAVAENK